MTTSPSKIPMEAVEAALSTWDREIAEQAGLDAMYMALEAAAPHMMAAAWDEGAATAWARSTPEVNGQSYQWRDEGEPLNPYRIAK